MPAFREFGEDLSAEVSSAGFPDSVGVSSVQDSIILGEGHVYSVIFGSDLSNYYPNRGLKVFKPRADVLSKIVNYRDPRLPSNQRSAVLLGDSAQVSSELAEALRDNKFERPSLMLTSPPYFGITDYHYDQWIRLWLLGDAPTARRVESQFRGEHQGKFANSGVYERLLNTVFTNSAKLLRDDAVIYVRADRREPTLSMTREALRTAFPMHKLRRINQPINGQTQTRLFGHHAPRIGEVDLILTPRDWYSSQ